MTTQVPMKKLKIYLNEKQDKYFAGHSNRVGVLLTCNPIRFDSTEPERLGKDERNYEIKPTKDYRTILPSFSGGRVRG